MKIGLSKLISFAMAAMITIIAIMGTIAISSILTAVNNSEKMEKEYLQEMKISTHMFRGFATVRVAMSKYLYTEEEAYYQDAQKGFAVVDEHI